MAQNTIPYQITSAFDGLSGNVVGTISGDNYVKIVDSVATATTDKQYNASITVAGLAGFYLLSTKAITVETNSGSAADYTWTLVANVPQFWVTGTGGANPLADDITAFFVTNASGATAQFYLYFLGDNSP